LRGIGGDEEITAPIQEETILALARQLLEEIDAAVHQRDHVVARARPPVAIALGGLVAGERERRALVDQHDAGDAATNRQMIRGGDPGDAGAADDDFRRGRAHAGRYGRTPLALVNAT